MRDVMIYRAGFRKAVRRAVIEGILGFLACAACAGFLVYMLGEAIDKM